MRCEDLLHAEEFCELAISPDGSKLAYVLRSCEGDVGRFHYEMYLAHLGTGGVPQTRRIGSGLRSPAWSPDSSTLAALEWGSDGIRASLCLYEVQVGAWEKKGAPLCHPGGIMWLPDGRHVGLLEIQADTWVEWERAGALERKPLSSRAFSQVRDGLGTAAVFRRRLVSVEVETGHLRELVGGDLWVDSFCWSGDRQLAFCAALDISQPSSRPSQPGAVRPLALYVSEDDGSNPRQLTSDERAARAPTFTSDNSEILFVGLAAYAPGLLRLYSVQAAGGSARMVAPNFDRGVAPGREGGGGTILPTSSGDILFGARDGGSFRLFRAAGGSGEEVQLLAGSETESVTRLSGSSDGRRVAFVAALSSGSQSIRVIDPAGGNSETVASRRELPGVRVPEAVEFTARDGLQLCGWLIRGSRRAGVANPLLVDVHGGSFSGAWSAQPDLSRLYQQEMAEAGWDVLLLNSRGSDGYGAGFATAAVGAWGSADAPDFHDAIDALAASGDTIADRVAVTGYSYGGFMANWLTATSSRFSAAVAGGSICDLVSLFGTSDMGVSLVEMDAGVSALADPDGALARSPISMASKVRAPTLLLHGAADLRCPIGQAEEWFAALSRAGCEVELVRYPGAAHSFLGDGPPGYIVDYGRRLVDWILLHAPSATEPRSLQDASRGEIG